MQAEVIAIGSELTSGASLDTNSQWLSIELAALGLPVHFHTTVADSLTEMLQVLQTAVERSSVVIVTGGLGPTLDDITRQAFAELVQRELVLDEPSLAHIREFFARRNRTMPERNAIQARFPAGSEPIPNPAGTAPGIWIDVPRPGEDSPCSLIALPGVPSEMRRMFRDTLETRLPRGPRLIRRARVNCFGCGESDAQQLLGEVTARGREPEVGITVHEATITLRITAQADTEAECERQIAETKEEIRTRLADYVFGDEDEQLQDALIGELQRRSLTLATVEAGSRGLLAHWLTDVANSKKCFLGGVVAPSETALVEWLGVDIAVLRDHGVTSLETALAMAVACRERFETDFSLAVTEFRADEESARNTTDPLPEAFVALAGDNLLKGDSLRMTGDPRMMKARTAKTAMNLLYRHLLGE